MTDLIYLAIDPGHTTGYAIFNMEGEPRWLGDKKMEEIPEWLETLPPVAACIIEEYRIFNFKRGQHINSKVPTIEVIGTVKSWATRHKVPIIEQRPADKATGYKWLGIKPSTNHSKTHGTDALAHGEYYLIRNGIKVPKM